MYLGLKFNEIHSIPTVKYSDIYDICLYNYDYKLKDFIFKF